MLWLADRRDLRFGSLTPNIQPGRSRAIQGGPL